MGLKPAEEERVRYAFAMVISKAPPTDTTRAKNRNEYISFLQRVHTILGLPKLVLCAAGLGPSAVVNMKDRTRVDLPFAMKEREGEFESNVLQNVANSFSAKELRYSQPSNDITNYEALPISHDNGVSDSLTYTNAQSVPSTIAPQPNSGGAIPVQHIGKNVGFSNSAHLLSLTRIVCRTSLPTHSRGSASHHGV